MRTQHLYIFRSLEKWFFFKDEGGNVFFSGNVQNTSLRLIRYNKGDANGGVVTEKIDDILRIRAGAGGEKDKRSGCQGIQLRGKSTGRNAKNLLCLLAFFWFLSKKPSQDLLFIVPEKAELPEKYRNDQDDHLVAENQHCQSQQKFEQKGRIGCNAYPIGYGS